MGKKICEKCKKGKATIRCTRANNLVVWWYCEPCYKEVAGDEPTSNVVFKREGFPSPDAGMGHDYGMVTMAAALAKYPDGPPGSPEKDAREYAAWYWVLTGRICECPTGR